jgi:hypothetical protein
MNDMFMNDFDAADPIIIRDPARCRPSQRAMSHEQSRAIKSSRPLSTPRISGGAVAVVAFVPPRRYSIQRSKPRDRTPDKAAMSAQCCAAIVAGSKEKPTWSTIREGSPGTS